jgi:hypothetical protein
MASNAELLTAVSDGTRENQISTFESEHERERALQHAVLRYLTKNGPTRWDDLFMHFPQYPPGKIAPALRHLAQWTHISVERGDILKISASGAAQLGAGSPRP